MHFASTTIAALAAILPLALAQTFTDCNPTLKSCPADTGLDASTFAADFTSGKSNSFSTAQGTTLTYGSTGADFKISSYGQAPTIQSDFYFLFGRVDVVMQAAPGVGVISSIVLESDDLDEIDWEAVGGKGNEIQSNYFGKGNTTTYDRAQTHAVSSATTTFHTYSIDWTAERTIFSIDGTAVRTLTYASANGGSNYPQTPMRLKLGNWTPPKDAPGTIQWAGGPVDWSAAPFSMYVKSVSIQNYNPATSYEYSDRSGSWQSIKIVNGTASSSPNGNTGSGSGSASSGPTTTASATGSGMTVSGSVTATSAPTSSHSVAPIQQTQPAGNSTSVSPTTLSSAVMPSTTGTGSTGGSTGGNSTVSPSSVPASPPSHTNAGSSLRFTTRLSLAVMVAGFFLL